MTEITDPLILPASAAQALIVDDSRTARYVLGKYLETLGCSAIGCADLPSAWRQLDQPGAAGRLVVAFADHDGSDVSFEALRSLRSHPALGGLPVVLCVRETGAAFAEQARTAGASAILVKPPSRDSLAALLDALAPGRIVAPVLPDEVTPPPPESLLDQLEEMGEEGDLVPPVSFERRVAEARVAQADDIRQGIATISPSNADQEAAALAAAVVAAAAPPAPAVAPAPSPAAVTPPPPVTPRVAPAVTPVPPTKVLPVAPPPAAPVAAPAADPRLREIERRLLALEQTLHQQLAEVRRLIALQPAAGPSASAEQMRAIATEEAEAAAERIVMGAAARISDRLAESILRTLGRG